VIVSDIGDRISNLIRALANRLTAADNWGPEGKKWQVLTSRGPRDVDPPPTFMSIEDILKGISSDAPQNGNGAGGLPGLEGPPGPAGPPGEDGANGMVPTVIHNGETFTVPVDRQALFKLPIDIELGGELEVLGALEQVDAPSASTIGVFVRGASWSKAGAPVDLLGQRFAITPECPGEGTITECSITGIGVGSAVFGVKKANPYPTGLADITGGGDAAIVSASSVDVSLVGWDLGVMEDDVFEFELKSVSGFTLVQIVLEITPT